MNRTRLQALLDAAGRRLGLARPAPPPPRAYTDEELIRRTGEFNQAAEQYWRDVASDPAARRHAFNKPLSTVQDTPGMFYRLGLVLDALDLGVGMTVLDFGAGGCWLSSCLNRLRCRTIAMDVSQAALDLGREMFEMDPRHLMDLEPRFVGYDGHHIGLPDASVDRAVMFDAFHHVPNQEEVLAELVRVLRPGAGPCSASRGRGIPTRTSPSSRRRRPVCSRTTSMSRTSRRRRWRPASRRCCSSPTPALADPGSRRVPPLDRG